jgi:hypothetical protein
MFSTLRPHNLLILVSTCLVILCSLATIVVAQSGTDFSGTVVKTDVSMRKLTVKKDEGGTRFTFTAHDKTQFTGRLKGLEDVKVGDRVVVRYIVQGSQYLAETVTPVPAQ